MSQTLTVLSIITATAVVVITILLIRRSSSENYSGTVRQVPLSPSGNGYMIPRAGDQVDKLSGLPANSPIVIMVDSNMVILNSDSKGDLYWNSSQQSLPLVCMPNTIITCNKPGNAVCEVLKIQDRINLCKATKSFTFGGQDKSFTLQLN